MADATYGRLDRYRPTSGRPQLARTQAVGATARHGRFGIRRNFRFANEHVGNGDSGCSFESQSQ